MSRFIEKQRHLIDFTLASLWRRKGKNLSLLAVYTAVVFFLASVMFFTSALKKEAALLLRGAPEVVVQRLLAGRHDLIPADYIDKIRDIPGVAEVRGRLWGYYYDPVLGANYTFMVPPDRELEPGQTVIGPGVAQLRQVGEGDIMTFRTYRGTLLILDVMEVLPSEAELVDADLIMISAHEFTRLFGQPEGYFHRSGADGT